MMRVRRNINLTDPDGCIELCDDLDGRWRATNYRQGVNMGVAVFHEIDVERATDHAVSVFAQPYQYPSRHKPLHFTIEHWVGYVELGSEPKVYST